MPGKSFSLGNFERGAPKYGRESRGGTPSLLGGGSRLYGSIGVLEKKFGEIFGILDFTLKFQGDIAVSVSQEQKIFCKKAVGSSKNANVHSDELMRCRSNNGFKG
jgi:hypothetical protein